MKKFLVTRVIIKLISDFFSAINDYLELFENGAEQENEFAFGFLYKQWIKTKMKFDM